MLAERSAAGRGQDPRLADAPAPLPGQPANPFDSDNPFHAAPAPPGFQAPRPTARKSTLQRLQEKGGVAGALASLLLLLAKVGAPVLTLLTKFKFLLIAGKLLLTCASMVLSMWVYARFFGWGFGIGFVLLIFIHECGHAFAGRLRGLPVSAMVFIPFMGAFVALKRGGRTVAEDAFIGIMGPIFGTLACIVCLGLYVIWPNPFWLALASWGFFINLFNLAPTAPLDGGWITPVFSPRLLAVGVAVLFILAPHNPLIWILAVLSLPRIIGGWKARPEQQPYYQVSAADRWKLGLAYFGLAAFLAFGHWALVSYLRSHFPVVA